MLRTSSFKRAVTERIPVQPQCGGAAVRSSVLVTTAARVSTTVSPANSGLPAAIVAHRYVPARRSIVGGFERVGDLLRDRQRFVQGDRSPRDPIRPRLALDQLLRCLAYEVWSPLDALLQPRPRVGAELSRAGGSRDDPSSEPSCPRFHNTATLQKARGNGLQLAPSLETAVCVHRKRR